MVLFVDYQTISPRSEKSRIMPKDLGYGAFFSEQLSNTKALLPCLYYNVLVSHRLILNGFASFLSLKVRFCSIETFLKYAFK
jgi:hypothetical protein